MAGTVTTTEERIGTVQKITFDWLSSNPGGAADATTTYAYDGQLLAAMFVPDTGGTAPDDQYDVTVTDGTYDLLNGQGADLSGTNTVVVQANLLPVTNDTLTLAVTNSGNANGGIVVLYLR